MAEIEKKKTGAVNNFYCIIHHDQWYSVQSLQNMFLLTSVSAEILDPILTDLRDLWMSLKFKHILFAFSSLRNMGPEVTPLLGNRKYKN